MQLRVLICGMEKASEAIRERCVSMREKKATVDWRGNKRDMIEIAAITRSTDQIRQSTVIMENLMKISKKARILELKRRHLKILTLTSYTPYPSRKIRRICTCTSRKTTKDSRSIRHIQKESIRRIQFKVIKYSGRKSKTWSPYSMNP
ncbi:hypothetical protein Tco_0950921 [Tanacetum coccineum]|uniref:Uncharacterized protein n=1 Tax=Tanacetum coccineum TaxID=301880 RepID=A0ABQ5DSP6_9ASTR